jgi:hypothetical protein
MIRTTLLSNNALRQGRNLIAQALVPLPPLQRAISENLSGLGISYHHEDRLAQLRKQLPGHHTLLTGDRVPDLELKPAHLTDKVHTSIQLFELIRHTPYSLFIDIAPEFIARDQQCIVHLLNSIRQYAQDVITPYAIFEQGSEMLVSQLAITTFIDFKQQFRHKLGTQHGSLLLVRPDGYLAIQVPNLREEVLISALRRWILPVEQKNQLNDIDAVKYA